LSVSEFLRAGRQTDRHSKENRNIFTPPHPISEVNIKYSSSVTKSPTKFPYSVAVQTVGRLVLVFTFDIPG